MQSKPAYGLASAAALVVALAACASTPPPTAQLAVARSTITDAQSAGAAEHAAVELRSAQENLARAQTAVREERNEEARHYAEIAEVDAKLAETRARSEKARRAAAEIRSSIETLRQELNVSGTR